MSLIRAIGGLINNTAFKVARLDASTHAWQVIKNEHHEIHGGSHYLIENVQDLSMNNVFDMQFVTPNSNKWTHFTFILSSESELEWMIYEDATILVTGSAITAFNSHRNVAKVTGNLIYGHVNANLAAANADTDVSGALELSHGILGAGKDAGLVDRSKELVLKKNDYLLF